MKDSTKIWITGFICISIIICVFLTMFHLAQVANSNYRISFEMDDNFRYALKDLGDTPVYTVMNKVDGSQQVTIINLKNISQLDDMVHE